MNPCFAILAASTASEAERFGQATGGGLVLLILIAGIIKCGVIMRRLTTSKTCVLALVLLLTGWMFSALASLLTSSLILPREPTVQITSRVVLLLMMVSLILGIVGLATFDKTRFQQGRAQAIWAVAVGTIAFLAMIFAIGAAVYQTAKSTTQAAARGKTGRPITNKPFNFSIMPSARWIELKPSTLNKLAIEPLWTSTL